MGRYASEIVKRVILEVNVKEHSYAFICSYMLYIRREKMFI